LLHIDKVVYFLVEIDQSFCVSVVQYSYLSVVLHSILHFSTKPSSFFISLFGEVQTSAQQFQPESLFELTGQGSSGFGQYGIFVFKKSSI
jgi:hypothetical protein